MQEAFDNLEGYFEERELDQKHDNAKEASLSLVCLMLYLNLFQIMIFSSLQLVQEQEEAWW